MLESLHNHTTHSDGLLSHKELFTLAESLGFCVLAFTDHDAVPNDEALQFLDSVRSSRTKWVIGIEVTARLPEDLGGTATGDFHILGLFVDPKNSALLEHCRKAQIARRERMEQMVGNLKDLGFRITEEDCLRMSGGDSVGRPHIVRALEEYPENAAVMEKLRQDMAKVGETNSEVAKKYALMMEGGLRQYPYALFLSKDAFRSAYVEHSYIPNMDEAVTLIRGAGGVASIAHYHSVAKKIPLEKIREFLAARRLDAMEVIYGAGLLDTAERGMILDQRQALRDLIAETHTLATGGADAHRAEDLTWYAEHKDFSAEANGLTTKLLDSGKVDRRFSSL